MIHVLTLEKRIKGARRATNLAMDRETSSRIAICSGGRKGYINRSGACLCDEKYWLIIESKKTEIEAIMKEKFPEHFGKLYHVDDPFKNPAYN